MERLRFNACWCGAILLVSSLLNGQTLGFLLLKNLCKFCDIRPSTCNGTDSCLSSCNITAICSNQDVCVAVWHRDGENTTVETVCHDPSLPFHGVMLSDYNNTKCVMKQHKGLGPNFYMCSCSGEECNEHLIFTRKSVSQNDSVQTVLVVLISLLPVLVLAVLITFYCCRMHALDCSQLWGKYGCTSPAHNYSNTYGIISSKDNCSEAMFTA